MIDSIDIHDLKTMLFDYVTKQSSADKVAKMFWATRSLMDTLNTDHGRTILEYLQPMDLFKLCPTNRAFHQLIQDFTKNDVWFDHQLLSHPAFATYLTRKEDINAFMAEWSNQHVVEIDKLFDHFRIGYCLQYKYPNHQLNQLGFHQMGARHLLQGKDMMIWKLTHHFNLKTAVCGYVESHRDPACYEGDKIEDQYMDRYYLNDDFWKETYILWDSMYGEESAARQANVHYDGGGWDDNFDLYAVVQITCPNRKWASSFLSKYGAVHVSDVFEDYRLAQKQYLERGRPKRPIPDLQPVSYLNKNQM